MLSIKLPAKKCMYYKNHPLNHLMEKRESIQYSSAIEVTGAWKCTSLEKYENELE